MSMSFEWLVIDHVREFGIRDTVRVLMVCYGYNARTARRYIRWLLDNHTDNRR